LIIATRVTFGKIQSFRNHLGPNQDIELSGSKIRKHLAEEVFLLHGIRVDAVDLRLGQDRLDDIFESLGADAFSADLRALALWADLWARELRSP
jgi:hypothetical protein